MTDIIDGARADWLLDSTLAPVTEGDPLAPLYAAAAKSELVLPFCAACGVALELEQEVCDACGDTERTWRSVALHGTVHAATVMYRRESGLVRTEAPYPVVDVELDSGHRLIMSTLHQSSSAPPIGTAVRIGFRRLGNVAVPALDTQEIT